MFAVFGVCKTHCMARAKKSVKPYREVDGVRLAMTEREYEQAVEDAAKEYFRTAKARKISVLFEARDAAVSFKELAEKTREARSVSIKRKDHLRKGGEPVLNVKTKKPRYTWVNV